MSGSVAKDGVWKTKEQGEENRWAHEREQAQLAALREKMTADEKSSKPQSQLPTGDIEGGFGGQEDLEDRYATTSGDH